jgi:hypothetical protein
MLSFLLIRQLCEGRIQFMCTCICKCYENVNYATLIRTVFSPGGSNNANWPATSVRWGTVTMLAVICARYGFVDIHRPLSFLWGLSITNDFYSTVSLFITAAYSNAHWCVFGFRIKALCIWDTVGLYINRSLFSYAVRVTQAALIGLCACALAQVLLCNNPNLRRTNLKYSTPVFTVTSLKKKR